MRDVAIMGRATQPAKGDRKTALDRDCTTKYFLFLGGLKPVKEAVKRENRPARPRSPLLADPAAFFPPAAASPL